MRRVDTLKLCLAGAAVVLFFISVRQGSEPFRWAAMACLVAAFVLRFIGRRR